MDLPTLWFLLIALLWTGYLILEGFDFGVGMLLFALGRRPEERDALVRTFGPVWDGNEVWLLVAGGAMFAAFPNWYASMFSAEYLPLLILLVALIVRVLAIEYRRKHDGPNWTTRWDRVLFVASVTAPLMAAVGLANVVHGIPMDAKHDFTGNLLDLLNPYSLLGGVAVLSLFVLHGATFLGLRTEGTLRVRARSLAIRVWPVATALVAAFGIWTLLGASSVARGISVVGTIAVVLAVVGLVATGLALRADREPIAFAGTALTIAAAVVLLFAQLWPNVMPSTDDPAGTLSIAETASHHYTLKVMTWVAILVTPVVLVYQAWSYWVFRHRISAEGFPEGGAGAALQSLTHRPAGDA
ncbi:Cytochrome d ubiquinol oxidase subunit II [Patulibacter medicamentivorans]|uniref:Cytochrome d ubiquinol oxidase subunit II n=1 Tax=Patulibacter medicamentivorans TaxID=1097667 RepID=H0E515_9ACTN|nr:cytochrome d ubiquinol oxidase subunit II [Patulibacter medicamentivorans]EHN11231.1 Cytochrome d ubiquinol oxidase subunit II [Patulibacter medicamentivorans]